MNDNLTIEQIKILNIFQYKFKPLQDLSRQKVILTTEDIFKKIQSIYPSDEYSFFDVCEILSYLKVDGVSSSTSTKYYWLLEEI